MALPPLDMVLALLPQSQTGTQTLPETAVIGGYWQGVGEDTQLNVETLSRGLKKDRKGK